MSNSYADWSWWGSEPFLPTEDQAALCTETQSISSVYITVWLVHQTISAALFDAMVEITNEVQGLGESNGSSCLKSPLWACDIDTHSAALEGLRVHPKIWGETSISPMRPSYLGGNEALEKSGTASCAWLGYDICRKMLLILHKYLPSAFGEWSVKQSGIAKRS